MDLKSFIITIFIQLNHTFFIETENVNKDVPVIDLKFRKILKM